MNIGLLEAGLAELGLDIRPEQKNNIVKFHGELLLWNRTYKLVGSSGDDIVIRHVLDCIAGFPVMGGLLHNTVADVGSGAGFPGILLAIWFEGSRILLVERSSKRASFLRNAIAVLGLSNAYVAEKPLEQIEEHCDLVTLRAFRQLEDFFPYLKRIVGPGGAIAAYKGKASTVEKEIAVLYERYDVRGEVIPLAVPFLNEERHMLLLRC